MTTMPQPQPFIYLATPHSHPEDHIREFRAQVAAKIVYVAMLGGIQEVTVPVYSPISHFHWAHLLVGKGRKPAFNRYAEHDFTLIANAGCIMLLPSKDNHTSNGVQAEIAFARSLRLPMFYLIESGFTDGWPFSTQPFVHSIDESHYLTWEKIDTICNKFLDITLED